MRPMYFIFSIYYKVNVAHCALIRFVITIVYHYYATVCFCTSTHAYGSVFVLFLGKLRRHFYALLRVQFTQKTSLCLSHTHSNNKIKTKFQTYLSHNWPKWLYHVLWDIYIYIYFYRQIANHRRCYWKKIIFFLSYFCLQLSIYVSWTEFILIGDAIKQNRFNFFCSLHQF